MDANGYAGTRRNDAGLHLGHSVGSRIDRIGDEAIAREDESALRAYFAEDYVFHGPGRDLSFDQLSAYFASLRIAFSDLRLVREQIIADGNFLAASSETSTFDILLGTHPS